MVNPNVFTVPADLQQTLCKYKVLAAEYVYRPLSEAEAQDWSNAMCLDKVSKICWLLLHCILLDAANADYSPGGMQMRQLDRWVQAALGALEWMRNERSVRLDTIAFSAISVQSSTSQSGSAHHCRMPCLASGWLQTVTRSSVPGGQASACWPTPAALSLYVLLLQTCLHACP